jgi:hypothetical protein
MEIGRPIRTIIIEPLELPEPLRPASEPERREQPELPEPEKEPVRHGD